MARAIWSGSISFCPLSASARPYPPPPPTPPTAGRVGAPTAQESPPIPPREPAPTRDVTAEEVVKGYEFAPERFIKVTASELEELAPEPSRTIDVEQFVQAAAVDPIYYETSYFAVPARDQLRPFAVLLEAMRQTESLGICWLTLRRKRHLAALRPLDRLMVLTTLFHADEVLSPEALAAPLPADLSKRERDMAALLIRTLTGPFEPERYRDEHRQRLLDLLERRASALPGDAPSAVPESPPVQVEELMAALKASVEEARRRRNEGRQANRRGA